MAPFRLTTIGYDLLLQEHAHILPHAMVKQNLLRLPITQVITKGTQFVYSFKHQRIVHTNGK